MKRIFSLLFISALFMGIISCDETDKPEFEPTEYNVSGKVEKGPFISGSTINLQPMDSNMNPNGSSFSAMITDHAGNFTFGTITLDSPYAQLTANGYFYNEVKGALSSGTLTLRALANLEEQSTVNVNILTHLKYARIMDLVEKENKSYADANKQAQKELLTQFGLQRFADTDASNYSITSGTPEAAALVAISSLILKNRTEAQVTEYLAKLSKEFGESGTFSVDTKAVIKNDRESLFGDIRKIEDNIKTRYEELGQTVTIDSLEYFFDWDDDGIAGNENMNSYMMSEEKLVGAWQASDGFYYVFDEEHMGVSANSPRRMLYFIWSLADLELELLYKSYGSTQVSTYQTLIIESITDTTITVYDKADLTKELIVLTQIDESEIPWNIDTNPNNRPIVFNIYSSQPQTKAYISSNSDIANNGGFNVWGFKNTDNESTWITVFDGTVVSSSDYGETWTYSPVRYWDTNAKYKFYAAGPALNTNGTIDFSDNTICVNNVHYMKKTDSEVECQVYRGVKEITSYAEQVDFSLSHIMSNVVFKVKKASGYDDIQMIFKSVTLKGWNGGNGNFKLNHSSSSVGNTEWTIPVSSSGVLEATVENGITVTSNPIVIGDYLMIPQSFDADALVCEVIFDIVYGDSSKEAFVCYLSLNKDMQADWYTGHKYEYTIILNPMAVSYNGTIMSNWDDQPSAYVW